jgi:vacuolar-type H+-ATPase subunit I/STV1
MGFLDPIAVGSVALIAGLLLIAGGLYVLRRGRLRTRQGAAVLAGFTAVLGLVAMSAGVLCLVRSA